MQHNDESQVCSSVWIYIGESFAQEDILVGIGSRRQLCGRILSRIKGRYMARHGESPRLGDGLNTP